MIQVGGVTYVLDDPLTLATLAAVGFALLMLMLQVTGSAGVAGVLAVAGVVCCACGIAGDMMQDLKVGHILGGTPWKMQVGDLVIAEDAGLVGGVRCLERDHAALAPQPLQGRFLVIHQGHHDFAIRGVVTSLDDHRIAIIDARLNHRIALHAEHERVRRVAHHVFRKLVMGLSIARTERPPFEAS